MAGGQPKAPFEELGETFVQQYYTLFDSNQKENLLTMYHPEALFTYEDNKTQGHDGIKEILMNKCSFNKIAHAITKVDCQPTAEGGVMVLVLGMLKTDDDNPIPYSEVFMLKPANNSYFIFHQMFRLSIHNM